MEAGFRMANPKAVRAQDRARRLSGPRIVAGVFAGLVGGLAFGVLMSVPAVFGDADFEGTGMMTLVSRLVGTDNILAVWGFHLLNSALFGLLFALAVPPRRAPRTVLLAVAWGALLWLVGGFLLLRALTGTPYVLDAVEAFNLLGHLLYGALLGVSYVAFYREEVTLLRESGPEARRRRRVAPKP